eukprot:GHVU01182395.1.p1 GENE.GHVU01182395.1~~GHVU01182395.1.p1  ORF type:complete len:251 (-),score=44.08 GHVU01182395.1:347-1099(-)
MDRVEALSSVFTCSPSSLAEGATAATATGDTAAAAPPHQQQQHGARDCLPPPARIAFLLPRSSSPSAAPRAPLTRPSTRSAAARQPLLAAAAGAHSASPYTPYQAAASDRATTGDAVASGPSAAPSQLQPPPPAGGPPFCASTLTTSFMPQLMAAFDRPQSFDTVHRALHEVESIKAVMQDNLQRAYSRAGPAVCLLEERAASMNVSAAQFSIAATHIRRRNMFRSIKLLLIVSTLAAVLVFLVYLFLRW